MKPIAARSERRRRSPSHLPAVAGCIAISTLATMDGARALQFGPAVPSRTRLSPSPSHSSNLSNPREGGTRCAPHPRPRQIAIAPSDPATHGRCVGVAYRYEGPEEEEAPSCLSELPMLEGAVEVEEVLPPDSDKCLSLPGTCTINFALSEPLMEVGLGALVLISSILAAIGTIPTLPMEAFRWNTIAEDVISYAFLMEFLLRWYSAGQLTWKYLATPLAMIDVVVVVLPLLLSKVLMPLGVGYETLPGWLMSNSGLVNLRLLRILRLQRILTDKESFDNFAGALGLAPGSVRPYQLQLARVVTSIFTLLSVSAGLIYTAEHDVNPQIPDYFTALYFSLTTLTTVGFGDITPITFQGRLVVSLTILAGVAVVPAQAASLVDALLDSQKEQTETREAERGGIGLMNGSKWDQNEREGSQDSAKRTSAAWDYGRDVTDVYKTGHQQYERDVINEMIACRSCGARWHRIDASFCWSCGTEL